MKLIILGIVLGMSFLLAISVFYIYITLKSKSRKKSIKKIGIKAEKEINNDIKSWSKEHISFFVNRGLYRYNNNKVFEVDSILITQNSLIIIEIKSIKGNISGNANDEKWSKEFKHNSYNISNPIKQNDRHIQHIMNIIKGKVPIVSLIIFSERSNEVNITNIPDYALVIKHSQLFETLEEVSISLPNSLSKKRMIEIKKEIKKHKTNSLYAQRLHKKITGRID